MPSLGTPFAPNPERLARRVQSGPVSWPSCLAPPLLPVTPQSTSPAPALVSIHKSAAATARAPTDEYSTDGYASKSRTASMLFGCSACSPAAATMDRLLSAGVATQQHRIWSGTRIKSAGCHGAVMDASIVGSVSVLAVEGNHRSLRSRSCNHIHLWAALLRQARECPRCFPRTPAG